MLSTVGGTPGAPGLRRLASLRPARTPTVWADTVLADPALTDTVFTDTVFTIASHLLCALR
jgi:hypothetical protein